MPFLLYASNYILYICKINIDGGISMFEFLLGCLLVAIVLLILTLKLGLMNLESDLMSYLVKLVWNLE